MIGRTGKYASKRRLMTGMAAGVLSMGALTGVAHAKIGDPAPLAEGFTIDPILDARLRYEYVDQPAREADALTLRVRAGLEVKHESGFSALAEMEVTGGFIDDYNALPFAVPGEDQYRPQYAVVADPQNGELNRLQLQYKSAPLTLTVGRQRINLDDQRWVGSVGWRQNEQTFDAVRAEGKLGPAVLDVTYSESQRTIFGNAGGPRQSYDGDFWLLNGGAKLGPVTLKAFAYLLDYDEGFFVANSSQTYGVRAATEVPVTSAIKVKLAASYAKQSDYKSNPFDYSADYALVEAGTSFMGFGITGGYELLGADNGRAVQTPMATLHKFDGWADVFLTTPQTATYAGLQDAYVSVGRKFDGIKFLPGLNASIAFHQFDSDTGDVEYGTEWDALIGFKLGSAAVAVKYANYDAVGFAVDTEKLWLQAEFSF